MNFTKEEIVLALCSYSSKFIMEGCTIIDNTFLNEFLPQATGDDVKVYLYGLNLCTNPNIEDNCLDTMSKVLSLTEDQLIKSFCYWQEMGLVQIVSTKPLEVRFLPARSHSGSIKIRNKEKYTDFNKQMQDVISGRMITPVEYNEYYSLIEIYHFEPEAIVLIAKYCTTLKNNAIGYPYILAVARSFANDGLKTCETIEQKFLEQEKSSAEIKQLLNTLGLKREADIEERNLYSKWTSSFGFAHGTIIAIAKEQKKKGGFAKLDSTLSKYYEQKLISLEDISRFSAEQESMFETAKDVSKNLGLYYQSLENVITTYITDWTSKGYDKDTLIFISNYCFKQSIRTLDGMNVIIQKFYKLGLISIESIEQYITSIIKIDETIKQVLDAVGLIRNVSNYDRDYFKTWTKNWNFSLEQILEISKAAIGKIGPMSYLNKLLADIYAKGITSDSEIKKYLKSSAKSDSSKTEKISSDFKSRTYSQEELSAVIDSLDDVEI